MIYSSKLILVYVALKNVTPSTSNIKNSNVGKLKKLDQNPITPPSEKTFATVLVITITSWKLQIGCGEPVI